MSSVVFVLSGCELVRDNPLDRNANQGNDQELPIIEFSKYEVYSDSNGDEIINKGESIKIKVFLKNSGTSRANKVKATISSNSTYISNLSPSGAISYYSNSSDFIDTNSEATPYFTGGFPSFNVSNTTPDNTTIAFTIDITDESNNTWTDSFTITVAGTGAAIGFSRYEVYSDSNGDEIINKGESIKLKVFLKNSGTSRANKVKATISSNSTYISNLSPSGAISYYSNSSDFININSEATPYFTGGFPSFNVSNTTPDNTTITFTIDITDESNNTWSDSFTITVI